MVTDWWVKCQVTCHEGTTESKCLTGQGLNSGELTLDDGGARGFPWTRDYAQSTQH
jgi:hypothetical protein